MHCPEADWFMAHCLPCYTQNLDELTRQDVAVGSVCR